MAKKTKRGSGISAGIIKKRKLPIDILYASGSVLAISVVFAFFGFIFFAETIPNWVQILLSFVFWIPVILFTYKMGESAAGRDFKIRYQDIDADKKDKTVVEPDLFKGVLYVLPAFVLPVLIALIAEIAKVQLIQGIAAFFAMPITLFCMGTGLVSIDVLTWGVFVIVLIYALSYSAAYIVGYILASKKERLRQSRLVTEMRSVRR